MDWNDQMIEALDEATDRIKKETRQKLQARRRDMFAAAALTGLLALDSGDGTFEITSNKTLAQYAFEAAAAMIEHDERRNDDG